MSMLTSDQTTSGTITSSVITLGGGEPDGAGETTYVPWFELERRARRRRIVAVALIAGTLLAAALAAVLWNANMHYSRGRDALAQGHYATAVEELAAARVLTLPYRDSVALGASAQRSLSAAAAAAAESDQRRANVTRLLEKAESRLALADAAGVVAAVEAVRRVAPDDPLPLAAGSADLPTQLALHIRTAAARDLAHGRWKDAVGLATAWLALRPADVDAATLLADARQGAALQLKLGRARAAAADGRWHTALRLARAILDARKGFPGAAAVVARARVGLAPAPAPKPAATTSPATSAGAAAPATPPQPPPP